MEVKVPALDKLLDYAASGIGAIAGPMLAPWIARQEAKASLIQKRAESEARIVDAETDATTKVIISDAQAKAREQLLSGTNQIRGAAEIASDGITQKIEFQERKRNSNVKNVIGHSAAGLEGSDVDDHEPDPDWTARFFDCIQDVSSEDMQVLWAKLLSGEVQRPGSTSLRTMDTLKNMTNTEAQLFSQLCNFVLDTGVCWVFNESRYIESIVELSHFNLVRVQDYGLLELGQSSFNITQDRFLEYNDYLLKISGVSEKKISFQIATLTTAGTELYRVSNPQVMRNYLRSIAEYFASQQCQLSYALIQRRYIDGRIQHQRQFTPIL